MVVARARLDYITCTWFLSDRDGIYADICGYQSHYGGGVEGIVAVCGGKEDKE